MERVEELEFKITETAQKTLELMESIDEIKKTLLRLRGNETCKGCEDYRNGFCTADICPKGK